MSQIEMMTGVPFQNSTFINCTHFGRWGGPFPPLSMFLTVDKLTSSVKCESVIGIIICLLQSVTVKITYITYVTA